MYREIIARVLTESVEQHKVWRDKQRDPVDKGCAQLGEYPSRLGLEHGYLVLAIAIAISLTISISMMMVTIDY